MKPLYTEIEFVNAKSMDKLPCECYGCLNVFYREKKQITQQLKGNIRYQIRYCSKQCEHNSRNGRQIVNCTNCNIEIEKYSSDMNKSKNNFCSQSCSTTHQNKNKTYGNRRSKLEKWLEEQLTISYPAIDFHFNRKDTIGSELDIYIPSLNIAFELNGIFHYEPIYSVDKLHKIQENDKSKTKACHDSKIDLCIINTSEQKYVKPSTSQKYLDIIINIIKERLLTI